jgi:hypothetical protein
MAAARLAAAMAVAAEWVDEAPRPLHAEPLWAAHSPIMGTRARIQALRAAQNPSQANTLHSNVRHPRWSARIIITIIRTD